MAYLSVGHDSFKMPIKDSWEVSYFDEDPTRAEVRFETGKYPVLGINVLSLDDPKLDKTQKFKKYLFDEVLMEDNENIEIKEIKTNIYGLEYEANLESGEKVKVWRLASSHGPRTIRVATIALSWMSGGEADKVVNKLLEEVNNNINECNFSDIRTILDSQADASAKISRLKFKMINPWNGLNIRLPSSWLMEVNEKDKSLALKVTGYKDAMLFLNCEEIKLSGNFVITMDYMQKIASNLAAGPGVKDISLHSNETNMYLISCNKIEEVKEENLILKNCFWHIFIIKENILHKLNFTYVFPDGLDPYLNDLIEVLDNNIKNLSFN